MFPPLVKEVNVIVAVVVEVRLTRTVANGPVNPLIASFPVPKLKVVVSAEACGTATASSPNKKLITIAMRVGEFFILFSSKLRS